MKTLFTHLLAAVAGVVAWNQLGPGTDEKRGMGHGVVTAHRAAGANVPGGKVRRTSGMEGRGALDLLSVEKRREAWLASFDDAAGWELRADMMVGWEEAQELRAEDKKRCTCKYSSLVAGQTKRYSPCQSRSRDGNGHKDDKEVMMKEGTAKLVNTVTDLLHE